MHCNDPLSPGHGGHQTPVYPPPAELVDDRYVEPSPVVWKTESGEFYNFLNISDTRFPASAVKDAPARSGRGRWGVIWWIPEIAWCCVSVLCVIAIIVVLHRYDGYQPPQWSVGITLNTFIAFFSSIAKLAFSIPVIEGLGQLKWLWFASKRRHLEDFELFDQATRGGLGCIKLLFRFKGALGCLGALIVLSGFFTSTLTQLMVTYYTDWSPNPVSFNATAPRATTFSRWNGTALTIGANDTLILQQAVISNAYLPTTESPAPINPICASGSCTWDSFGTLAVCSKVVNLTAQGNLTLLSNLENSTVQQLDLWYQQSLMSLKVTENSASTASETSAAVWPVNVGQFAEPSGAIDQSLVNVAMADMFIAFADNYINITAATAADSMSTESIRKSQMTGFQYFELMLYWCVPELHVQVNVGIPNTQQAAVSTKITTPEKPHSLNMAWSPDFSNCAAPMVCNYTLEGETVVMAAPDTVDPEERAIEYVLDVNTAIAASGFVATHLEGGVLIQPGDTILFEKGNLAYPLSVSLFGNVEPRLFAPDVQIHNVQSLAANIAAGVTNMLRDTGVTYPNSTGSKLGRVYGQEQFVKIQWLWVILIASQLMLSSIFLTVVILSSHQMHIQILKSTTLPIMMALNQQAKEEMSGIHDVRTLKERARKVMVKLERSIGGVGLWLGLAQNSRFGGSRGSSSGGSGYSSLKHGQIR